MLCYYCYIYKFWDRDINLFLILLLRKSVYPYEYMDSSERFDEVLLSDVEAFYSNLNMEDITSVGNRHAKRAFKSSDNKNIGCYHDLYLRSDTCICSSIWKL